eukprot:g690.t1
MGNTLDFSGDPEGRPDDFSALQKTYNYDEDDSDIEYEDDAAFEGGSNGIGSNVSVHAGGRLAEEDFGRGGPYAEKDSSSGILSSSLSGKSSMKDDLTLVENISGPSWPIFGEASSPNAGATSMQTASSSSGANAASKLRLFAKRWPTVGHAWTPFHRNPVWKYQNIFYKFYGPKAWTNAIVPNFVSSNAYIAKQYTSVIQSFLLESRSMENTPILLEIGAGSGKLGYLILRTLLPHLAKSSASNLPTHEETNSSRQTHGETHGDTEGYTEGDIEGENHEPSYMNPNLNSTPTKKSSPPFIYVFTDISQKTLDFYRRQPCLKPYFDAGVADVAIFDIHNIGENVDSNGVNQVNGMNLELQIRSEKLQQSIQRDQGQDSSSPKTCVSLFSDAFAKSPFFLIANYVFDSLPMDAFRLCVRRQVLGSKFGMPSTTTGSKMSKKLRKIRKKAKLLYQKKQLHQSNDRQSETNFDRNERQAAENNHGNDKGQEERCRNKTTFSALTKSELDCLVPVEVQLQELRCTLHTSTLFDIHSFEKKLSKEQEQKSSRKQLNGSVLNHAVQDASERGEGNDQNERSEREEAKEVEEEKNEGQNETSLPQMNDDHELSSVMLPKIHLEWKGVNIDVSSPDSCDIDKLYKDFPSGLSETLRILLRSQIDEIQRRSQERMLEREFEFQFAVGRRYEEKKEQAASRRERMLKANDHLLKRVKEKQRMAKSKRDGAMNEEITHPQGSETDHQGSGQEFSKELFTNDYDDDANTIAPLKNFCDDQLDEGRSFLFPVGAIELLRNLSQRFRSFVVLCGDKGYASVDDFPSTRHSPHIAIHGSISAMVNFSSLTKLPALLHGQPNFRQQRSGQKNEHKFWSYERSLTHSGFHTILLNMSHPSRSNGVNTAFLSSEGLHHGGMMNPTFESVQQAFRSVIKEGLCPEGFSVFQRNCFEIMKQSDVGIGGSSGGSVTIDGTVALLRMANFEPDVFLKFKKLFILTAGNPHISDHE